jgi:hypothetical protein
MTKAWWPLALATALGALIAAGPARGQSAPAVPDSAVAAPADEAAPARPRRPSATAPT